MIDLLARGRARSSLGKLMAVIIQYFLSILNVPFSSHIMFHLAITMPITHEYLFLLIQCELCTISFLLGIYLFSLALVCFQVQEGTKE